MRRSLFFAVPLIALQAVLPAAAAAPAQDTEETSAVSSSVDPNEIRRGVRMGGEHGKTREQVYYERLLAPVEPDFIGKPERLPHYIKYFRLSLINDPKIIAFDADATVADDGTVVLSGYSGFKENAATLEKFLTYLGFTSIENNIEQLPSESLGDTRYGIVDVTHVITYDQPEEPREQMTNALLGDHVFLLMEGANHTYLCNTAEGYVSFMDASAVRPVGGEEFTAWLEAPKVAVLSDQGEGERRIPAGARLPLAGLTDEGDYSVRLPDGSIRSIPSDAAEIIPTGPGDRASTAMKTAQTFLGSDYVWGGKTTDGVDCSGLVQSSYRAAGVNLARDAYQQAYGGELVGTRWYRDHLRGGDTLYFLGRSGRITHTALYLADNVFIEASGGSVRLTSFDPASDLYREVRDRGFCFAKRVIP